MSNIVAVTKRLGLNPIEATDFDPGFYLSSNGPFI